MGEAKPWQIGVVVLGLLVLVGSIVYQCQSRPSLDFAETQTFVDVRTGELWISKYRVDRGIMYPVKHPTTGEPSLFPAKNESGTWVIRSKYLFAAAEGKLASPDIVNLQDGTVKPTGDPKKFDMYAR